jgi:superfamily I DNA and/or RNA helicase/very-short-patch-repair endonuclease
MNESFNQIKVEFIYTPVINFAIQQNRIPIIRKLKIENASTKDLDDLTIEITADQGFESDFKQIIELIPVNKSIEIEVKEIILSSNYLRDITEKLAGVLTLVVASSGDVLLTRKYPIDILPFDYWDGIGVLPEILAAYITPNHPEIPKIIQNASVFLKSWTGNSSFDAYQSLNPDRVKKQLGAIFEEIANRSIIYNSPPASFETFGQRIRMSGTIFEQKIATCLDMSVLYASCIEAIGLNPLIIFTNGHAFIGAWLVDDTFPDNINDDISLLKKRSANGINEIILVESTCMNEGQIQSFDEAIHLANTKLNIEDDFLMFIDIKRARLSGIKPLPERIKNSEEWEIIENKESTIRENQIPEYVQNIPEEFLNNSNTFSKQKLWERKLLDLSLRNTLLNLRITQNTIQLISISLESLEDSIANGNEFQVIAKPEDFVCPDKNYGIYNVIGKTDPIVNLIKYDLQHNRLRSYLNDSELKAGLTKLYRTSRVSLEENGANTLYLAIGFLKWFETPKSELARYAPILLLPIEIIRKSAQTGFIIRSREEDPQINITLLEMLKQDFNITINGLDDLPKDESGVDVKKIFTIIRRGILVQTRWDLEEHAFLGIFSFSKFIMWNDIHINSEKLLDNKIVGSIISGKLLWDATDLSLLNDNFDTKFYPSEIALPISADSAQLEAILAASENTSFILHGPPGTGKSQTITNIIANSLYQGKRVLFVAEKMAALSVVQKRLTDIGLDKFCLELHSNKSKKSLILEQLRKTTEIIKKSSPVEFIKEAERLHNLRSELNDYVHELHLKHQFGFSLYDSFTGYAEINNVPDSIYFDKSLIEKLTKDQFIDWCDLVEELQNSGSLCGHPHNHPLTGINATNYNLPNKDKAKNLLNEYISLLDQKSEYQKDICRLLKVGSKPLKREETLLLEHLVSHIIALPDTPESLISTRITERILAEIIEKSKHGINRDIYRKQLLEDFTSQILEYNAEQNLIRWKIFSEKWLIPKLIGQNKILKSIRIISKRGKLKKSQIETLFEKIIQYQKENDIIEVSKISIANNLGFLWNDGNCDWLEVKKICENLVQINGIFKRIINDASQFTNARSNLCEKLLDGTETFLSLEGKKLLIYLEITSKQKRLESELNNLLSIDFESEICFEFKDSSDWTTLCKIKSLTWLENIDQLRDWTNWNRVKEKVNENSLSNLILAYENGEIKNSEVLFSFKKSLFRHFAEYIIQNNPILETFNGKMFESKIRKFKEQLVYFEELTKAELFSRLASQIPSFTQEASNSSEIGILQRAIRNNGRSLSIRKLFDQIPNLLPRLCPCMLMSPISVAQFIDVNQTKFDLVIFDEASQLPTCEAIGVIARGQNLIVVGDPKQLPPTSFFSTNQFDEDNSDKEDLESILDDCLAISMPSKYLLWHYRSKHESLIAFSNTNYYENKLMTFPSPDDLATKVKNVYVPGYYDRGKTRQNKFEAIAIVDEVIKRLSDPFLSKFSIGIITFSSVQQNLIEDLLNEAFKSNFNAEKKAFESNEPIFIKNLENVQGDERDIILFSVGYAPDKDGKIYLNFGPLNREGGWRRLNVAVSRARYEMIVFSTLRSEQIDISRSSSQGVAGIKSFLEYTEKGIISLPQKENKLKIKPHFFEELVACEIRKFGYSVNTNIGCSGYRIDIGVINPMDESKYILGILTDGETYFSAKTVKDREAIQPDVLEMLGWNIYRLWTPDWWDNPQKIIQEIIQLINNLQEISVKQTINNSNKRMNYLNTIIKPDAQKQSITQKIIKPKKISNPYIICSLNSTTLMELDDFFEYKTSLKIMSQVKKVLKVEAPISHNLLSKRILNAWGISRLGGRLNSYFHDIYNELELNYTIQNNIIFYWDFQQEPEKYDLLRVAEYDQHKRNAEDIPKEEVKNCIKEILNNQISLPEEDLIKEVAKIFGFNRLGGNVEQSMKFGLDYSLTIGLIDKKNDRIVLS